MRLLTAEISSNCDIALHGDTHQDNIQSSDSGIEQTFEWIRRERNRRFIFMGDAIEAITTDDKRYQHDTTVDPIPMRQLASIVDKYRPIAKRGLAWLAGNHEFALQRFGDLGAEMAGNLEIPYGGCAAKLLLKDKHGPIAKLYLCHPSRFTMRSNAKDYEQRVANMKAAAKRFLVDKAGDCVVMAVGHTHKLLIVDPSPKLVIFDEGGKLKQDYLIGDNSMPHYIDPDRRWYLNTGSYLRTMLLDHDGYAERAGYDPIEIGFIVLEIRDRKVVKARRMVVGG
jgi:predicted phosphodiesterase